MIPFIWSSRASKTHLVMTEIKMVFAPAREVGWVLAERGRGNHFKGQGEPFWGDGNILYFNWDGGYRSNTFAKLNQLHLFKNLLYVNNSVRKTKNQNNVYPSGIRLVKGEAGTILVLQARSLRKFHACAFLPTVPWEALTLGRGDLWLGRREPSALSPPQGFQQPTPPTVQSLSPLLTLPQALW